LSHAEVWDLIPWWINGRLAAPQRPAVEAHLRTCSECRAEVRVQQALMDNLLQGGVEYVPSASLQKLWKRIDAPAPVKADRTASSVRWLAAAVVLQALGLAWLGNAQWSRAPTVASAMPAAEYRTLAAPAAPAPGAVIRAVFSPALTLGELQNLLALSNLKIVSGPTEAAVYSLAAATASQDPRWIENALARLRAHPGVRFAEPIVAVKTTAPSSPPG